MNDIDLMKSVADPAVNPGTSFEAVRHTTEAAASVLSASPFMTGLTVFVLAAFVGYYVIWKVTPALHSPLMAVTNAISSVIIVGALLAAGPMDLSLSKIFGFLAVVLASINIFGGFLVSQRMLAMFKKKEIPRPASTTH